MQQQGGSHFGAPHPPPPPPQPQPPPPLPPALSSEAEAVPPISSRPPRPLDFDELATTVSGSLPEEADRGGASTTPGNRWPRHETLALIRIRSDMDDAFREATLKGPLWEEVSRKLAEQGITRSSKKCKEKFDNVHKYYKRTKEGRAGRQDGKHYRFSSELEALHHHHQQQQQQQHQHQHQHHHSSPMNTTSSPATPIHHPTPITSIPPPPPPNDPRQPVTVPPLLSVLGLSSGSDSEGSDSETEDDGERKRKHRRRCRRRTMALFAEMVRKVMEQQEATQQRLLDVIEKREQDRMAREEAWRRQEAARASREHELAAHERSLAASRDAAIIAFLRKISDQSAPSTVQPGIQTDGNLDQQQLNQQQQDKQQQKVPSPPRPAPQPRQEALVLAEAAAGTGGDPASSRWPKAEVLALIDLRTALDARYNDSSPKGPLWEEISGGMRELGYSRSAKRCKEKWENINKYFKKVKESNKKRPEDAKTCPYFHHLDAIYRSRSLGQQPPRLTAPPSHPDPPLPTSAPPLPASSPDAKANGEPLAAQEKAEGTVRGEGGREASKQSDVQDSASISGHEDDDYDDEEDDEEEKMAYKIEFQRPSMGGVAQSSNATGANPPTSAPAATGSFVAMVQ